jgi:hypothetical protein
LLVSELTNDIRCPIRHSVCLLFAIYTLSNKALYVSSFRYLCKTLSRLYFANKLFSTTIDCIRRRCSDNFMKISITEMKVALLMKN